jgi:RNA polymerase-binding transcription factor DksA
MQNDILPDDTSGYPYPSALARSPRFGEAGIRRDRCGEETYLSYGNKHLRSDMPYTDKKFLKKQKSKLLQKRKNLYKELNQIARKKGNRFLAIFPNFGISEDENAEEVEQYTDALSLQRQLEKQLTDVNIALEKIKKKRYGYCENCKKNIDKKRLIVYPEAETCLKCS